MITFGKSFAGSLSATADVSFCLCFIPSKSSQAWSGFAGGSSFSLSANSLISSKYFATADRMASASFSRSLHVMNASAATQATFEDKVAHLNGCMPATAGLHVTWK